MDLPVSPLAPASFPDMPEVDGVRLAVAETGLKYRNRPDLLLAEFSPGTAVAGVLTRSTAPGNPVVWCRRHLPSGAARALVVNAGNANVFTGAGGWRATEAMAGAAAAVARCEPGEVMVASTGVIGEPLEHEVITGRVAAMEGTRQPPGRKRRGRSAPPTPSPRARAAPPASVTHRSQSPGSPRAPA